MAFDDKTRSRLQHFVSDARTVLTNEFTSQLQNDYGLDPNTGNVMPLEQLGADDARRETARLLRETFDHYAASTPNAKSSELLGRIVREQAFTILNRIVALRMCEARGLLVESIGNGTSSRGFQLFQQLAGAGLGATADAYRTYILSVFDQFSVDLGALFDRFSPMGLLFPDGGTMLDLIGLVNDPQIVPLLAEDETIGWLYQYFSSKEERKKMRDESSAPRNSRELAVRNQFFTPRYVVEFLTDNTLGRIWYEMTKGETALKTSCRYLVRRPTEIFLATGEVAPAICQAEGQRSAEGLSKEELLNQPFHIPHRPLKDPRDLRLLDPACGSMHFGLYAFDLFAVIYAEAWEAAHGVDEAAKSGQAFASFVVFAATFADKVAFLRDVPRLILEHNLYGIDIDPRAVQIAGLSLWLRAQRAWQQLGVKPSERPDITRSNIVCAEPMPGGKELLLEFVEQQFPDGERPAFGFLLHKIFDSMTVAAEAGSLLQIEQAIRDAILEARTLALSHSGPRQDALFPGTDGANHAQFDLRGLNDEQFWQAAEQRIYRALETYAEQSESGGGFRRRLFAADAARGFAFIDLCRRRYDVVLMNPPFGSFSEPWLAQSKHAYPNSSNDILGAFVDRFFHFLHDRGRLGAITSRTCFFLTSFKDWRESVVLGQSSVTLIADLGQGVMDSAMVEAAAYVLENTRPTPHIAVFRAIADSDRQRALEECLDAHREGRSDSRLFLAKPDSFRLLPDSPFVYWIDGDTIRRFHKSRHFEPNVGVARNGMTTGDDPRWVRTVWEVAPEDTLFCYFPTDGSSACSFDDPIVQDYLRRRNIGTPRWAFFVKAGASQPWYSPITLKVNWADDGEELKNFRNDKGKPRAFLRSRDLYHRPGFSWTRRAVRFFPYIVPSNCIPSVSRYMAFPNHGMYAEALAVCASRVVTAFLRFYAEFWQRPNFLVDTLKALPWPELSDDVKVHLESLVKLEVERRRLAYQNHEPFHEFLLPVKVRDFSDKGRALGFDAEALLDAGTEKMVADGFGFSDAQAHAVAHDLIEAISYQRSGGAIERALDYEKSERDREDEDDDSDFVLDYSDAALEESYLSYLVGSAFGRWDVRYATGDMPAPELSHAFAPLPVCPPGMLQGDDGLPLSPNVGRQLRASGNYPLDVVWDGVLVDDPEHQFDIERSVRAVLTVVGGDQDSVWESEACARLGVPRLREWFSRPDGFFASHLRRYTKSRRQAPIYWPLSTVSGSYTLWIYYPRLTDQTLFICVNEFVEPKLRGVRSELSVLASKSEPGPRAEKRIERLQAFVTELEGFRGELLRLTELPWKPNLNDGVQITAAPLWRLFRLPKWQKTLKKTWEKIERGDYDWAHLAYVIRPNQVREKCVSDKSLAIAHGLDELYVGPPTHKKGRRRSSVERSNEVLEFD